MLVFGAEKADLFHRSKLFTRFLHPVTTHFFRQPNYYICTDTEMHLKPCAHTTRFLSSSVLYYLKNNKDKLQKSVVFLSNGFVKQSV